MHSIKNDVFVAKYLVAIFILYKEIKKYFVSVEKFCIMPNHIFVLFFTAVVKVKYPFKYATYYCMCIIYSYHLQNEIIDFVLKDLIECS